MKLFFPWLCLFCRRPNPYGDHDLWPWRPQQNGGVRPQKEPMPPVVTCSLQANNIVRTKQWQNKQWKAHFVCISGSRKVFGIFIQKFICPLVFWIFTTTTQKIALQCSLFMKYILFHPTHDVFTWCLNCDWSRILRAVTEIKNTLRMSGCVFWFLVFLKLPNPKSRVVLETELCVCVQPISKKKNNWKAYCASPKAKVFKLLCYWNT